MLYTYLVRDITGRWFKSRYFYFTKEEAVEEAMGVFEYDFVERIQVLDEDDEDLKNFERRSKLN